MYYIEPYTIGGELYHHGIKGMKWGVRRFQNEDGSYKSGAQGRYDDGQVNKARGRSTGGSTQKKKGWSTKKKVAVGLGVAAGIAGTALAARYGHRALALGKGAKAAAKLRGAASKLRGKATMSGERLRGVKARVGSPGDIAKRAGSAAKRNVAVAATTARINAYSAGQSFKKAGSAVGSATRRAGSAVKGAAGRAGNAAKTSATKVGNKARDLKTRMTGINEKAYKGKRAQAFKDMVKTSNKAEYKKTVDNLEKLQNRRKKFTNAAIAAGGASAVGGTAIGYNQYQKRKKR